MINFGYNRKWSGHSDLGFMEEAKNEALPQIMRINALAKARVNRHGHSEFGPGELADFFGIKKNALYNLINKAKAAGLFLDGSGSRCIILSSRVIQRNSGNGGCKHHNLNKSGDSILSETEEETFEALVEDIEVPEGIDPLTGEILEEASESLSKETVTLEDTETVEEPETAVQSLTEASQERLAKYRNKVTITPVKEEVKEEEQMEAVAVTLEDFLKWTDELSELGQDLAYHGLVRKTNNSFEFIMAVVLEGLNEKHDEWGSNVNMRYTYAEKGVAFDGNRFRAKKKELVGGDW